MTTGQVDANRISLVKSMADETEEDIGLDACRIEWWHCGNDNGSSDINGSVNDSSLPLETMVSMAWRRHKTFG